MPPLHEQLMRIAQEMSRRARLDAAIAECAQRFADSRDLVGILRDAVPIIRDQIGLDRVGIFLYDADGGRWTGVYGTDVDGSLRDERRLTIPRDDRHPLHRAARGEGDVLFTQDFSSMFPQDEFMRGVTHHFFVALRAHGRLLGGVSVDNKLTDRPIDEAARQDLVRFARYISLAIENFRLTETLLQRNEALSHSLEERESLLQELRDTNEALRDFAHEVSHDLKAPLRGIQTLAGCLAEDAGTRLKAGERDTLVQLRERATRLQAMISGLLRYSEAGYTEQAATEVDVAALVSDIVDDLALPETYAVDLPHGLPVVRTSAIALRQIMQNLMENAAAHCGRAEGRLTITAEEQPDGWRFRFADDGPGIPEDVRGSLFKPFARTGGGTGIGLAVAKKLAIALGGRLELEAPNGEGAAFLLLLPETPEGEQPQA